MTIIHLGVQIAVVTCIGGLMLVMVVVVVVIVTVVGVGGSMRSVHHRRVFCCHGCNPSQGGQGLVVVARMIYPMPHTCVIVP